MLSYIGRRVLYMIPTLFMISIVSFLIIQLPPGDYLSSLVARIEEQGGSVDSAELAALRDRYGLDESAFIQYWKWISGIVWNGDFGQSFEFTRPVTDLIAARLPLTLIVATATLVLTWVLAVPIGIYSAVKQYSIGDYLATTLGFLGLATPNFLLALVLMWIAFSSFGMSVGGQSPAKFVIAVIVLGTAGTAALVRILRANLLDELRKPYVVAARARGVPRRRRLVRYPLRVAMNPFVSAIGWFLPTLVSGEVIVASVMNLDTTGPLLLGAFRSQDMYLAGSIIMIVSVLTVAGMLISDLALAWLDPRIRLRYR